MGSTYVQPNMDYFVDVEFFQKQRTVLCKYLYVIYSFCGAICYENCIRFKFRCFVIAFLCVAYFFCTIPQLRVLIRQSELEDRYNAIGYVTFIQYNVINLYLFYLKREEFRRLFDLINENSNEPIPFEIADSNREGDYLKETNILKICFRIFQSLIVTKLILYFGKIFQKMIFFKNPFEVLDEGSEFYIPFFCGTCNTILSYTLAYNLSFLSTTSFATFYNGTFCLFIVLSIYFKNRAISLRNDIKYYSDVALERFDDLDRLEEQELKRRRPCPAQLRDIAEQREKQVKEFMNRVHPWIRIHQRLFE